MSFSDSSLWHECGRAQKAEQRDAGPNNGAPHKWFWKDKRPISVGRVPLMPIFLQFLRRRIGTAHSEVEPAAARGRVRCRAGLLHSVFTTSSVAEARTIAAEGVGGVGHGEHAQQAELGAHHSGARHGRTPATATQGAVTTSHRSAACTMTRRV